MPAGENRWKQEFWIKIARGGKISNNARIIMSNYPKCVLKLFCGHHRSDQGPSTDDGGHSIRTGILHVGLYQKCFFFFKKCFWHCSLSSQKMLKISRDSLKNAFSHFLSRLKIRSNKQMIKGQDTGMGGGGHAILFQERGRGLGHITQVILRWQSGRTATISIYRN